MTWNKFFEMVANNNITDEVMAKARTKVEKASFESTAKLEKRNAILAAISSTPQTAQEVADSLKGAYSRNTISSVLVLLAREGLVKKSDSSPRTYSIVE